MKNFKLILKSLISNHSCVEGGRKKAWYFAVPMLLLALILAIIPIFVQNWTKEGDTLVKDHAYELDTASFFFLKDIEAKGIEMKVENKTLHVNKDEWDAKITTYDASGNRCWLHYHNGAPDLGVYYVESALLDQTFYNTITTFPGAEEGQRVNRTYSFYLFTENSTILYIYAPAKPSNQQIGTIYGDYKHMADGYTINSMLAESRELTWVNWKAFYRATYQTYRIDNTWKTCLIVTGINAGITIFMGFMLWVLTRGKNNLRWFNLWETQKIAYWATISPAILTTGLGFLIASFSQVMFPLLLGVRIMWLSMKLLRPENADVYPPLKDEKVVDVKPIKTK